jgi:cytochrome P450
MKRITDLLKFLKDPIAFLDELAALERPVVRVKLGPKRFVMVFEPSLAEEVLKNSHFVQNRSIFDRIRPITGTKGLVQLEGDESRKAREQVAPLFAAENMLKMKKIIELNTDRSLEAIKYKSEIDIARFMTDLVLKNAFELFLGIDVADTRELAEIFQELNHLCGERMIRPMTLPLFIPTQTNRRIKSLRKSLRSKISSLLAENKTERVSVASLYQNTERLDHCLTFLFAGHETTAASISFTLLSLAREREVCDSIAAGADGLALKAYKEALRLYPPAYMLVRQVHKTCVIGERRFLKGEQVIIAVKQIHHSNTLFSDAHQFNPKRGNLRAPQFLPFGLGPKACIGEALAYLEAVTIIKAFVKKFQIAKELSEISAIPLVTLHPAAGQLLRISERSYV